MRRKRKQNKARSLFDAWEPSVNYVHNRERELSELAKEIVEIHDKDGLSVSMGGILFKKYVFDRVINGTEQSEKKPRTLTHWLT